eukprot:4902698-Pyramimonas_sp.AAC.1
MAIGPEDLHRHCHRHYHRHRCRLGPAAPPNVSRRSAAGSRCASCPRGGASAAETATARMSPRLSRSHQTPAC